MSFDHTFYEIAALVLLAAAGGLLGLMLRQPLVVSFIGVGILAGPDVLGLATSTEYISLMAEISIAVLLFLVGLKLDIKLISSLGPVALSTGLGQVTFTAAFGFLICSALGIDPLSAAYIAVALTFSSTIIIVKLLSDKREIDSLHGRIALGFLIVQDIVVVLAMVTLSAMGVGTGGGIANVGVVIGSGVAVLLFVALFIRYAADPVLRRVARSSELLIIAAVGWALGLGALGDWLGFGMELGGLLAGISLASTQYRDSIASRLSSLRDFLLLFFFLGLGASLDLSMLGDQAGAALILSLFVLIGNPLIVLAIMGYMGYRKRTGFLAGLTVAQISEFSLIFMGMGISIGHVTQGSLGLVTLVGLVTIALSTYMITYSHHLYNLVEPWLDPFERKFARRELADTEAAGEDQAAYEFILFGLGRYGSEIGRRLIAHGHSVLGVDFDPEALETWRKAGHDAHFGDATDPEFASGLPLARAKAVISAVPRTAGALTDADPRVALMCGLRDHGFTGKIAVAMHTPSDADTLSQQGADVILTPFSDAAEFAVAALEQVLAPERLTTRDG